MEDTARSVEDRWDKIAKLLYPYFEKMATFQKAGRAAAAPVWCKMPTQEHVGGKQLKYVHHRVLIIPCFSVFRMQVLIFSL